MAPLNFLFKYYINGIIFRDYSVTVQCSPLSADHHNEPLHCLLHFFDLSLLLWTNRKKLEKNTSKTLLCIHNSLPGRGERKKMSYSWHISHFTWCANGRYSNIVGDEGCIRIYVVEWKLLTSNGQREEILNKTRFILSTTQQSKLFQWR